MMRYLYLILCVLLSQTVRAGTEDMIWHMTPEDSHIGFRVNIQGTESDGVFPKFTSRIVFDPANLDDSRVEVVIDLSKIEATYQDVEENLPKEAWFDVARFPIATFKGGQFQALGNKMYSVTGQLTIRDVTRAETLHFSLLEYGADLARIEGKMKISRLDYGVGQGDWSTVSFVGKDVFLDVALTATRRSK
ncbi:YceI family protein [Paremcibacter congregatus]|nr:YceI family protein [Paremcibacter congregatus]